MVEHHPNSPRDPSRLHQIGKKVSPGILLGYELIAVGIWKGDILSADLEDLGKLDASEISDQIMYGLKYGAKLGMPFRIEKTSMEKREANARRQRYRETFQNVWR